MQVELFKKIVPYKDKDGKDRTATNFYAKCGTDLIPIEVVFFPDKETGNDPNYRGRKMVLSAFSEDLPEREDKKEQKESTKGN